MDVESTSRNLFQSRPFWGSVLGGAAVLGVGAGVLRPGQAPRKPEPAAPVQPAVAAKPAARQEPQRSSYLRVGLRRLSGKPSLEVKALSAVKILDGTGRKLGSIPAGKKVVVTTDLSTAGVRVSGAGLEKSARDVVLSGRMLGVGTRRYPGKLAFQMGGAGLEIVNELEIEQYLEGVLPGELPRSFGLEAQKAQAVAARTYALVQRGKHGEFDLCDRTHCQMYVGMTRATGRAIQAVRSTRHQVLTHGGDLVYAFYSADCGGISTNVDEVPIKDKPAETLPYLTLVRDNSGRGRDYCATSPYHAWSRRFTHQELEDRLNSEPETYVGKLREVKVLDYDPSGRVRTVLLRGVEPALQPGTEVASTEAVQGTPVEKQVHGWIFRRSVGPIALKSTLMRLDQPGDGVYRFQGSGFGHGLGLCQIGANGLARRGRDYRQILAHYYPGTKLERLPG